MKEYICKLLQNDKRILVFGDFMVDEYLYGTTDRISPEAPVPVVAVKQRESRLGGAGNVVRNLFALGAQVSAVTYIGADANGNWIKTQMEKMGVNCDGIVQSDEIITTIKTRITAKNQQLLRCDNELTAELPTCFLEFLQAHICEWLSGVSAVIISDYGKGVVTAESSRLLIEAAERLSIPVIVDPKGTDYHKYHGAAVCTPNMAELRLATRREARTETEILEACTDLCRECGIKNILATRSEKGMSFISASGDKRDYPAIAKEVVDVTGAGDTVISVFALCYAAGIPVDDCCRLGNIGASVVVSKFGCATVSFEEIMQLDGSNIQTDVCCISRKDASAKAAQLKQMGKKIVFTNGCFDIVHAGHISSFRQAKNFGDVLFLGLNSDASIRRIKGENRPIVSQQNRAALLAAISYIDYIVIFDEDTPEALIRDICPDVLVKGVDWSGQEVAGGQFVKEHGGEVKFIDLEKGLSTTAIIEKILNTYGNECRENNE